MAAEPFEFWAEMAAAPPASVRVAGVDLRRGSRVRLRPSTGGDVMNLVLAGRAAVVEGIDRDDQGGVHIAVAVENDPGRELGMSRHPGHRFYFRAHELEPLPPLRRVLVAGIGNVFLGDDGFGVAVARRLAGRELAAGVTVRDFGIRGMDLAYALRDYDAVVFIDAAPRGREPGTLYVIDAGAAAGGQIGLDTHGMDPVRVLALARAMGPLPERVLVVGCEPAALPAPNSDEVVARLSERVAAAVAPAVAQVEALLEELLEQEGGA